MKKILALALFVISATADAGSVIANGTRFIYPSSDKEITVKLTNTGDKPALIQSWMDEGNPNASPDDIVTPFVISPPISRIDGNSGQTLRVRMANKAGIATDRESLWYLNVLEIPPSVKKSDYEGKNILMMAIRSRFKFIYRPTELGSASGSAKKLSLSTKGKMLHIDNPTPFYISVPQVLKSTGTIISSGPVTLAPKSSQDVKLSESTHAGEKLTVVSLNDFGSPENNTIAVK